MTKTTDDGRPIEYIIQLFYIDEWLLMKKCPVGVDEDTARDMLEDSRVRVPKRELRLVEVTPPPYVPASHKVLDA